MAAWGIEGLIEKLLCVGQRAAVEDRNTAAKNRYHVHTAISVKKALPTEQALA